MDAADGAKYALRVCSPGWRTAEDLRAEVRWLEALARDTDIGAPVPLRTRSGGPYAVAAAEGVRSRRRCLLMSWVPGTPVASRLTPESFLAMGRLSARLHAHAGRFAPPADFTTQRLDGIFARGEPDLLFGRDGEAMAPLRAVRERVETAFADLFADPSGLRVIHNDLHQDNVAIERGRLRPFDFEDTIWGYPVYDVAMTLNDLLFFTRTSDDEVRVLRAAFRRGYSQLAEWPETRPGQVDTFIAGRDLWLTNWIARFQPQHLGERIERQARRFRSFLEGGRLGR